MMNLGGIAPGDLVQMFYVQRHAYGHSLHFVTHLVGKGKCFGILTSFGVDSKKTQRNANHDGG